MESVLQGCGLLPENKHLSGLNEPVMVKQLLENPLALVFT
jgi:hypothetical protein